METLIIEEIKDNLLITKLTNILDYIDNPSIYKWKLFLMDGINYKIDMRMIDTKINNSSNGYFIEFQELIDLSESFYQLWEVILVGDRNEEKLLTNKDNLKDEVDFFIELVDTSFWEVTSKNISFLNKLKERFSPKIIE